MGVTQISMGCLRKGVAQISMGYLFLLHSREGEGIERVFEGV
jgi:hypothetical protein